MPRSKVQLLTKPTDGRSRSQSPRLLQRAASGTQSSQTDRRATAIQRLNESAESVIAVVLRSGQPMASAELEVVPAGAAITPDSGKLVVAFINDQGRGQRFGASGSTRLSRAQTAQEFPGLASRAVRMLKGNATATPVGVQRDADSNATASSTAVEHALTHSSAQPLPARQRVSQPHDHLEIEADAAAAQAMQGQSARLSTIPTQATRGSAKGQLIARRADQPSPPVQPQPVVPAPTNVVSPPAAKAMPVNDPNGAGGLGAASGGRAEPGSKPTNMDSSKGQGQAKKTGGAGVEASDKASEGAGDAGLQSVLDSVSSAASAQKEHPSVESKQHETLQAVDMTPEEAEGKSKAEKGKQLATAKKQVFNKDAFKEALRAKIRSLKADEAKQIKEGDQAQAIVAVTKSGVAEGKQTAAADIAQKSAQPAPAITPTQGAPLPGVEPGPKPTVDVSRAVPPPVEDGKVSLASESQTLDSQMTAANVTPEQLRNANEPAFQAAADSHQSAKTEADALPTKARARESQLLTATQADMVATTDSGLAQMNQGRTNKLAASAEKQAAGKAKYEETRARINKQLSEVYATTEKSVNERMAQIDKDVAQAFDDGALVAKARFYAFLATRLLIYYASGFWLVDTITGGATKESIFKQAQDDFEADMLKVIDTVADIVEVGLNEVIGLIATGRANLEAEVARLDPADRAIGNEVAGEFRNQFAQLEKSVEEKQTQIIESVAKKYHEAQQAVESTIATLRNPVGALIDLAKEQIAGVIETILNLKNMLFGLLAKASAAIDLIIKDPIAFLGNLVAGVKLGLMNFVGKIGTYLQKGLLEWLFGALAGAGIQLPDKFDLSGLFNVVLQVLGLTWTNIRARAVKAVGENTVKALETGSQIIMALVTKGVSGLWEYIKEQAASLIETVKEGIKSFVMESIVVAGVKWLVGLLNPASAFVKACMAIYDIMMFIINRGQQIMAFVNAVLDSVLSIAQGAIGVAANAVENALARALPVAIGFLASLLGLGDLSGKIKKVIDKIQEPVNRVIDWLIARAVAVAKRIASSLGLREKTPTADSNAGEIIEMPLTMHGEKHVLSASWDGKEVSVVIHSKPLKLWNAILTAKAEVRSSSRSDHEKAQMDRELDAIATFSTMQKEIENLVTAEGQIAKKRIRKKLEKWSEGITPLLVQFGQKYKVKSLEDLSVVHIPTKRYLPANWNGKRIRKKLYSSSASEVGAFMEVRLAFMKKVIEHIQNTKNIEAWNALKYPTEGKPVLHSDADINTFDTEKMKHGRGKMIEREKYQFGHEQDLAEHWNTIGHNSSDEDRLKGWWNVDVETIESNLGSSGKAPTYVDYVGPDFTSRRCEIPGPGAKTIDGQDFRVDE